MCKEVTIFTDGACRGNPDGPGGYGSVLIYKDKQGNIHQKEVSGGFSNTTNNRMELMAAIAGIEALKEPCNVVLYSDSKYLVDAIEKKWVYKWQNNSWMRDVKKRIKAKNIDLWKRLLSAIDKHNVVFKWVKGHAGILENELCDKLATEAAMKKNLPIDNGR